jgi:hypothetical protein
MAIVRCHVKVFTKLFDPGNFKSVEMNLHRGLLACFWACVFDLFWLEKKDRKKKEKVIYIKYSSLNGKWVYDF